jgi:hypothetical protein
MDAPDDRRGHGALRGLRATPNPDHERLATIFNDFMNRLSGDPGTERLRPLVEDAAAVGAEHFIIDADWYDDTDGWWDRVGEWQPGSRHEVDDERMARLVTAIDEQVSTLNPVTLELTAPSVHATHATVDGMTPAPGGADSAPGHGEPPAGRRADPGRGAPARAPGRGLHHPQDPAIESDPATAQRDDAQRTFRRPWSRTSGQGAPTRAGPWPAAGRSGARARSPIIAATKPGVKAVAGFSTHKVQLLVS